MFQDKNSLMVKYGLRIDVDSIESEIERKIEEAMASHAISAILMWPIVLNLDEKRQIKNDLRKAGYLVQELMSNTSCFVENNTTYEQGIEIVW